jgi:hypothetical protein
LNNLVIHHGQKIAKRLDATLRHEVSDLRRLLETP